MRDVDLKIIPADQYPVFHLPDDLTTLQLMVLCWLINYDTFSGEEDCCVDINEMIATYEAYDCSENDLIDAMAGLINRNWGHITFLLKARVHQMQHLPRWIYTCC